MERLEDELKIKLSNDYKRVDNIYKEIYLNTKLELVDFILLNNTSSYYFDHKIKYIIDNTIINNINDIDNLIINIIKDKYNMDISNIYNSKEINNIIIALFIKKYINLLINHNNNDISSNIKFILDSYKLNEIEDSFNLIDHSEYFLKQINIKSNEYLTAKDYIYKCLMALKHVGVTNNKIEFVEYINEVISNIENDNIYGYEVIMLIQMCELHLYKKDKQRIR